VLNVHFSEPADGDDYTWCQCEVPGVAAEELRDPADVLRIENEQLRTRLHDLRMAFAQRRALDNRIESILSEGA
jgi:hypothetical protein